VGVGPACRNGSLEERAGLDTVRDHPGACADSEHRGNNPEDEGPSAIGGSAAQSCRRRVVDGYAALSCR